jgi:tetratricopeptide (TPR) repeat protein
MELNPQMPVPQLESFIRDNGIEYILAPGRWANVKEYELLMYESYRLRFREVYSIGNLNFYQVSNNLNPYFAEPHIPPKSDDTISVRGLLLSGRHKLLNEDYAEAIRYFQTASQLVPDQAELVYQLAVSYDMVGDTSQSLKEYQKLFSMPQAGSYLMLAKINNEASVLLTSASRTKFYQQQLVETWKAAKIYWSLGYQKRARSLMNNILENDSTYFMGLLWGIYFNLQLEDTVRAKDYLGRLEKLDAANPVVVAFSQIINKSDSLSFINDYITRCKLHSGIAELYYQIELTEDAIDEAYKSARNVHALELLLKIYEKRAKIKLVEKIKKQMLEAKNSRFVVVNE